MPAKNPRLTITLQPTLAAQLRKLSELTGNSQSGLIGELLEGSGPVFDRMIQVMEAAKTAKEAMRGRIAGDIEKAQSRVEEGLGMALEGFDQWTGSLLDEVEVVTRRGVGKRSAARPGASAPTPMSNRGVRYDPKATKNIAQSRLKVRPESQKVRAKNRGGE